MTEPDSSWPERIPPALMRAVRMRTLVPLIGAGLSKQASPIIPTWTELLEEMRVEASAGGFLDEAASTELGRMTAAGKHLAVAEQLRFVLPTDAYLTILEERFRPQDVEPSRAHDALVALNPPLILTTNYDKLIEDAFAQAHGESPTVWTYSEAASMQRSMQSEGLRGRRTIIFKLHGTIDDPGGIILSEHDYRSLVYRQPGYRLVLSAIFLTRAVLMVGFSLDDPELRLLLENHRESLKYQSGPDYALLPTHGNDKVAFRRLREDFGVQAIPYDPQDEHVAVEHFLTSLSELATELTVTDQLEEVLRLADQALRAHAGETKILKLSDGRRVRLSHGHGERVLIEMDVE